MIGQVILVLAQTEDRTADAVVEALWARGADVARMDTADFPLSVQLAANPHSIDSPGSLCTNGREIALGSIRSVYRRHPAQFAFPPDLSTAEKQFATLESVAGFGGVLAAQDWRWIDLPSATADASYKPRQLRRAVECGMRVPQSLVTNCGPRAREFAKQLGGQIIYKSLSTGVVTECSELRIIYTARLGADDLDDRAISTCCHLFQQWVPKAFDVRMTVVGTNAFAVAVHVNSVEAHTDWRSRYADLSYEVCTVPKNVHAATIQYLRSFNLTYGAFDFSVTPDGQWWFLECNPSGQWGWIADETGLPIAEALAAELTAAA